jgi:signal transduction histidine kinase
MNKMNKTNKKEILNNFNIELNNNQTRIILTIVIILVIVLLFKKMFNTVLEKQYLANSRLEEMMQRLLSY